MYAEAVWHGSIVLKRETRLYANLILHSMLHIQIGKREKEEQRARYGAACLSTWPDVYTGLAGFLHRGCGVFSHIYRKCVGRCWEGVCGRGWHLGRTMKFLKWDWQGKKKNLCCGLEPSKWLLLLLSVAGPPGLPCVRRETRGEA